MALVDLTAHDSDGDDVNEVAAAVPSTTAITTASVTGNSGAGASSALTLETANRDVAAEAESGTLSSNTGDVKTATNAGSSKDAGSSTSLCRGGAGSSSSGEATAGPLTTVADGCTDAKRVLPQQSSQSTESAPVAKKAKNEKKSATKKVFVVIWIPTNGNKTREGNQTWASMTKLLGCYTTKALADKAKWAEVRKQQRRGFGGGSGTLLMGDSWDDEVDVIVQKTDVIGDGVSLGLNTSFALLWIPCSGKGGSKTWSKLKVCGVYKDVAGAEEHRQRLLTKYTQGGRGDIICGETFMDEIDLVIVEPAVNIDDVEFFGDDIR